MHSIVHVLDECLTLVAAGELTCRVYIIYMKQGRSKVIRKHRISAEPVRPKIRKTLLSSFPVTPFLINCDVNCAAVRGRETP